MNVEEAIMRLREAGFVAEPRSGWACGVISCHSPQTKSEAHGIECYRCGIALFQIGEWWGVDLLGYFRQTRYEQRWSLEEAVELAIRLLSSDSIPIDRRDIEITSARTADGDSVWMTHKPTGIVRPLKRPGEKMGSRSDAEDRAYRDITFEVAGWKGGGGKGTAS